MGSSVNFVSCINQWFILKKENYGSFKGGDSPPLLDVLAMYWVRMCTWIHQRSYLLNEKRRDILSIEDSSGVKILIIADPYKLRPYYKVIRIKNSEVRKKSSYDLTPESPNPDTSWRDEKSVSKLSPLVDATDHKKNHKSGGGILSWIKSLTSDPKTKKPVKKKSTQKRRSRKTNYRNKKNNPAKTKSNRKPASSSKSNRKPTSSKNTRRPVKRQEKKSNKVSDVKNTQKKAPQRKSTVKKETTKSFEVKKDTTKKITGRQDIVKESKKKPEPPTRALNDPRDN